MKLLHVSHGYLPECTGGVEFYLRELMAAQQAAGDDVVLVSGCLEVQPQAGVEEVSVDGVRVLRLNRDDWYHDHYARAWNPEVERLFEGVLAQEKPDIVHVHQWIRLTNNLVELAQRVGIPAVVTLHDVYTSCPRAFRVHKDGSPCFRRLSVDSCLSCVPRFGHESDGEVADSIEMFQDSYRSELLRARRVLVAMQSTADLVAGASGLPARLFTVNGLGYRRRLSVSSQPGPVGDCVRFAHWGTLVQHKGTVVLLDAFRELQRRGLLQPSELHLFGPVPDPHFESILHERAKGLAVIFHGSYSLADVVAANVHVGVFPSTCFETYGLVLAECFELGLPGIVSDLGALPERAGEAALKVPADNIDALAQAMERLASEPALRAQLQAATPGLPPSPDDHAARLARIYEEVLADDAMPTDVPAPTVSRKRRDELRQAQQDSMTQSYTDPSRPPKPA